MLEIHTDKQAKKSKFFANPAFP